MRNIYTLIFLFTLSIFSLSAQNEFVNDGGAVYLESGAELYVHGEVKMNSGATLDNEGFIQVDASSNNSNGVHWVSNTTKANQTGSGLVKFYKPNGTGTDNISISGSGVKFYDVEFDVADLVGGTNLVEVDVNNDVEVTNILQLNNGKLVTGANEVYVTNTNANAVASTSSFGANKSNYVQGILKREVVGGNNYVFPIGSEIFASTNTGFNPVTLNLTTVPGGQDALAASFNKMADIGNVTFLAGGYDCTASGGPVDQHFDINEMVDNYGYWSINASTSSTGWNYDLVATPSPELLAQNSAATFMKILKAPGASPIGSAYDWSSNVLNAGDLCTSGVNIVTGTFREFSGGNSSTVTSDIKANNLNSFSEFGIGKAGVGGLPIELVSLEANPINNEYIRVDWITSTEINNAGFEVQRSVDGVNFREIGWIDGAGNSVDQLSYSFNDYDVEPNKTYYYRLKQIDFDGEYEITYIVNAMITKEGVLTVGNFIPNPTNGLSQIQINSSDVHKVRVTIFTTLGQVMNIRDYEVNPGLNKIDFDFSMLADGTYHAVIVVDESEVHNKKVVITK